jgi:hypothetical protein
MGILPKNKVERKILYRGLVSEAEAKGENPSEKRG